MGKNTRMILCALFAVLTAIGAWIRIPMPLASFTLQIVFTAMAGVLLGSRWGAVSQLIYLLLGLAGLPVFTVGGGLQALAQPTGGFLLALIPMAWVVGHLTQRRGLGFGDLCLSCAAGLGVLYLIGLPWLHMVMTVFLHQDWTIRQTLISGMLLFLPWDAGKLLLVAWLTPRLRAGLIRP